MAEWLQQFTDAIIRFTGDNPSLTGLLLLVFTAAEAVIIVGALVPGEAVVLALAAAAGAAGVSPWSMLLWVTLGAIIGDGISYMIGRRFDDAVAGWPLVRSHPELLARAKTFIHERGALAIIIGRFLPGLRAIMPVAAGILGMPPGRFYLANAISAVAWAAVHVFPAALLGQAYNQLGAVSGRLTTIIVLLLLLLVLLVWLVRAFFVWVAPRLAVLHRWLVRRLARRQDAFSRRLAEWLDPRHPNRAGMIFWGLVLILAIIGIVEIIEDLFSQEPMIRADTAIHNFLQGLRSQPMDRLMVTITSIGDDPVILVSAAALVGTLLLLGAFWHALGAGFTIGTAAVLVPLLKNFFRKPRPLSIYEGAGAFSFPSGHTTLTTVVFGVMVVLLTRRLTFGLRLLAYGLYALVIGLIGFSRVYLAAHWPTDVIGGFLIGIALVAVFALWLEIMEEWRPHPPRRLWLAPLMALIALVVVDGVRLYRSFDRNLARYVPRQQVQEISLQQWLRDGWRTLPQRRIDLKGEREEPVLLQWADNPTHVRKVLTARGWHYRPVPSLRDALVFLLPEATLADLPPLPLLHEGRFPALMFTRSLPGRDERLVLRLWQSNFRVRANKTTWPLHLGTITRERLRRLGPLGNALRELPVQTMPGPLEQTLRDSHELGTIRPENGPWLVQPVQTADR